MASRAQANSRAERSDATDFAGAPAKPVEASPLSRSHTNEGKLGDMDSGRPRSYVTGDDQVGLQRSTSRASTLGDGTLSRGGTLKKKSSLRRKSSLKRSNSAKSFTAGSIKGVTLDGADHEKFNSVFYTPVPTNGSPTDILVNRFSAWRKFLKDLITYFREVQVSYEQRAKSLLKVSNVINNTTAPSIFLSEGGINDANRILRDYHRQSILDANKARDIEEEIVIKLGNLRTDLAHKIKEIKSLSGDFKNSVEKEKEATRKAVGALEVALNQVDSEPGATIGKGDPYVVRLGVERQIEKQIDEENYLHRAYLNLEGSGRELESIIVGEIQKSYNALASLMKRDADESYNAIDKLRTGPISMPRDLEWTEFVEHDPNFVNPNVPLRRIEDIEYPGKHHPAAAEVRAGMLERKSKYLKSYTPGWYVLSATHLHEFKSADRIHSQPPVMSLYLLDQKLGSHSQPESSSHKFMLKGRQTGSMHRGHSWVFRAESYDTMLAWYEDILNLTQTTGEARNAFVRSHARSISGNSHKSVSSDGMEEDEADAVPYSANASTTTPKAKEQPLERPSPGGRFPSDLQVNRNLQASRSPSSASSTGRDVTSPAKQATRTSEPSKVEGQHVDSIPAVKQNEEPLQQERSAYEPVEETSSTVASQQPYQNRDPTPIQQEANYVQSQPLHHVHEYEPLPQQPTVQQQQTFSQQPVPEQQPLIQQEPIPQQQLLSQQPTSLEQPITTMPDAALYQPQTYQQPAELAPHPNDAPYPVTPPRQDSSVATSMGAVSSGIVGTGPYNQSSEQSYAQEPYQQEASTGDQGLQNGSYNLGSSALPEKETPLVYRIDEGNALNQQPESVQPVAEPVPLPIGSAGKPTYLTYSASEPIPPVGVAYDSDSPPEAELSGASVTSVKVIRREDIAVITPNEDPRSSHDEIFHDVPHTAERVA